MKKSFKDFVLDLIYPIDIRCLVCAERYDDINKYGICKRCIESLSYINSEINTNQHYSLNSINTVFEYKKAAVSMVHSLKYKGKKYLAEFMAGFMIEKLKKSVCDYDIVVPVPLHRRRMRQRGYNQSQLLAEVICKELDLSLDTESLKRVKDTKPQAKLNKVERMKNIIDAFSVEEKSTFKMKRVLIIDDVFTTGATIEQCSLKLLQSGAVYVGALTFASGADC